MSATKPTPEELAHLQTLRSLGTIRYELMDAFPDSFGGLYNSDGQESFVVLVVGAGEQQEAIQSYVANYLKQASPTDSIPLSITYAYAAHSLSSLFALRDRIVATGLPPTQATKAGIPQVLGVGINAKDNTVEVRVLLDESAEEATKALQAAFQSDAIQAVPSGHSHLFLVATSW
jgi:hypothetical protein